MIAAKSRSDTFRPQVASILATPIVKPFTSDHGQDAAGITHGLTEPPEANRHEDLHLFG